jgi:hypothetical protein
MELFVTGDEAYLNWVCTYDPDTWSTKIDNGRILGNVPKPLYVAASSGLGAVSCTPHHQQ